MPAEDPPADVRLSERIAALYSNVRPGEQLRRALEPAVLLLLVFAAVATALILPDLDRQALLSPAVVAGALVLNLMPAIALLVLLGRRIAGRRATAGDGSEARLHKRLVLSFSATAAVPTIIVVAFSSYLFQSGMEFWFSDRSRGMFENAVGVAQDFYDKERADVSANTLAMATDLRNELGRTAIGTQPFYDFYIQQVVVRELSESSIIEVGRDGVARSIALINPDSRAVERRLPAETLRQLDAGQDSVTTETGDRVDAVVALIPDRRLYLYASRSSLLLGPQSILGARAIFADYNALLARSRDLQFRFVLALYIGALIIVGLVIFVAILVADRIVKPIGSLAGAAQEIAGGNLEARVRVPPGRPDEIATLALAFNRMSEQLSDQTRALVDANIQLDDRRSFIEAVLSSVASGVFSLDTNRAIRFVNAAAAHMVGRADEDLTGKRLRDVAPELDRWLADHDSDPILSFDARGEQRTWAVKIASDDLGLVITADDITQQLLDQRRAAWSDVARRIAHEIKNPLTPIQLAAERLQRRFGAQNDGEPLFGKLTSTIVRQVGDLRRIVDEFSDFAKMPKPVFREDSLVETIKQCVFLQEIGAPSVHFSFESDAGIPPIVCDRRLLSQAFTNILKNAVEAIAQRNGDGGHVAVAIVREEDRIVVHVADDGIGLPADRDALTQPYVTNREGGTGLGLAIVEKIIQEHQGTLSFADRPGGGSIFTICFWPERLSAAAPKSAARI